MTSNDLKDLPEKISELERQIAQLRGALSEAVAQRDAAEERSINLAAELAAATAKLLENES